MTAPLRMTPLHAEHVAAGAKMVPFAGFEMPIHYATGITAEHRAVRSAAGIFDVSHMGEIEISGPQALDFVQFVTTNDASSIDVGQAQYSTLTREDGKLLDDLLVYRRKESFLLVVNSANRERDHDWIASHAPSFDARLEDRSDHFALLALQGPRAQEILGRITPADLEDIAYYRFTEATVAGGEAIVSRTGYTGEDGFEIYIPADFAVPLWRDLLDAGHEQGLVPAGLGARDSLRLEMGYALYGSDLDETRDPFEAGLGWVVRLDKDEFVGRDALLERKKAGVPERLIGFRMLERSFPRPGYAVRHEGNTVGSVTSGTLSPSLGVGIGMAYLPTPLAIPGTVISIDIRGQSVPAEVIRPPFYTTGSIRR
jgi:aminomethyltransferase